MREPKKADKTQWTFALFTFVCCLVLIVLAGRPAEAEQQVASRSERRNVTATCCAGDAKSDNVDAGQPGGEGGDFSLANSATGDTQLRHKP